MVEIKIDMERFQQSASVVIKSLDNACEGAIKETCEEIQELAKEYAPVRTGTLRDSITMKVDGKTGEVYPTVPYAKYVENGTRYMLAKPFMRPAFDAATEKLAERVVKKFK